MDGDSSASVKWESISAISRQEKRDLRRKLKLQLEEIEGLVMKIDAQEEQLRKGLTDRSVEAAQKDPDTRLGRTDHDNKGTGTTKSTPEPVLAPTVNSSVKEPRLPPKPSDSDPSNRPLSTSTRSCGGREKRNPKANPLYLDSNFVSGKDKVHPQKLKPKVGQNRRASGKKESTDCRQGNVEENLHKPMAHILKQCGTLLKKLLSHKSAWVFKEPVDAKKLKLHDYHKVIEKPMDLGTIKKKLDGGLYVSALDFAADIRLTFANAVTYNPPDHDVHLMAIALNNLFEELWKNIRIKVREDKTKMQAEDGILSGKGVDQIEHNPKSEQKTRSGKKKEEADAGDGRPAAHPKPKSNYPEKSRRPMTYDEKEKLGAVLQNLPSEKYDGILKIIQQHDPNMTPNDDEFEVDIDSLDDDTLWDLDRFVTTCAKSMSKAEAKTPQEDPSRAAGTEHYGAQSAHNRAEEIRQEVCKGGAIEEEDVDIENTVEDGSHMQHLHVVSENEEGAASSSSSSGSGSDSGSSSNSSDSASSSQSDSSADLEQPENLEFPERVGSPTVDAQVAKEKAREADDVTTTTKELTSAKFRSALAVWQNENLIQRQVSQENSNRAAQLKHRYADTILKAEKTLSLHKIENIRSEGLRGNQDLELEKKNKEEKANLHYEAKAMEMAGKTETEAAVQAQRKSDAEREAARIELQEMERAVEIDGNHKYWKELQIFKRKDLEDFNNDAISGIHSNSTGGITTLNLQDRSPLHQLGLYIKKDEEEEKDDDLDLFA